MRPDVIRRVPREDTSLSRAALHLLLSALVVIASARSASAILHAPTDARLVDVRVVALTPALRLTLVFDGYMSVGAASGESCGSGFRIDTGVLTAIEAVRIVVPGTDTPIAGIGIGWEPSSVLAEEIESRAPADVGTTWVAFEKTLTVASPVGVPVEMQIDVVAELDVVAADVLRQYQRPPNANVADRLFVSVTDGTGMPLPIHQHVLGVLGPASLGDTLKCQRAVGKASSKFVKAKVKALHKCENAKLRDAYAGTCPDAGASPGSAGAKAAAKIAVAAAKLNDKIAGACGGRDRLCGGDPVGEAGGALLGLPPQCQNLGSGPCAGAIDVLSCTGVVSCLECIETEAVDAVVGLVYGDLADADPTLQTALNKCQQALGKGTTKYLLAKEKILQKCWDKRYQGKHAAACPDHAADPILDKAAFKAAVQIGKAESKLIAKICKRCGGPDGRCDDVVDPVNPLAPTLGGDGTGGDLLPADILMTALPMCPEVTVPAGAAGVAVPCLRPIDTLADLIFCLDCVTEFMVDCMDAARVPDLMTYPAECNP